jgi:hypothetical protein
MAQFSISAKFVFYDDRKVEAESYDEAEQMAQTIWSEWLPYSVVNSQTNEWSDLDTQVELTGGEVSE